MSLHDAIRNAGTKLTLGGGGLTYLSYIEAIADKYSFVLPWVAGLFTSLVAIATIIVKIQEYKLHQFKIKELENEHKNQD